MKIKGVSIWIWLLGCFVVMAAAFALVSVGNGNRPAGPAPTYRPRTQTHGKIQQKNPVDPSKREHEIKRLMVDLHYGMSQLALGTEIEALTESSRDRNLKMMEKEALAGKVAILQRDLDENDKSLAKQTDLNEGYLEQLKKAVARSKEVLIEINIDGATADELQSLVNHCEEGMDGVQRWKSALRLLRSNLSLQEALWLSNGDRSAYDKAHAEYDEVFKHGLAKWKE